MVLADHIVASDVANRLAAEMSCLVPNSPARGCSVLVTGPEGEMVHKVGIEGAAGLSS
jgi:hypothetical protein